MLTDIGRRGEPPGGQGVVPHRDAALQLASQWSAACSPPLIVSSGVTPAPRSDHDGHDDLTQWEGAEFDVRTMARFLGGPVEQSVAGFDDLRWAFQLTEKGVWIGQGLVRGVTGLLTTLPTGGFVEIAKRPWEDVDFVWIADEGVARVNMSALATFGILGIGARRQTTSVVISIEAEPYFFETKRSIVHWRAQLSELGRRHPQIDTKLLLNEPFPTTSLPTDEPGSVEKADSTDALSETLRALEKLRNDGLLSDAEYQVKRDQTLGLL